MKTKRVRDDRTAISTRPLWGRVYGLTLETAEGIYNTLKTSLKPGDKFGHVALRKATFDYINTLDHKGGIPTDGFVYDIRNRMVIFGMISRNGTKGVHPNKRYNLCEYPKPEPKPEPVKYEHKPTGGILMVERVEAACGIAIMESGETGILERVNIHGGDFFRFRPSSFAMVVEPR